MKEQRPIAAAMLRAHEKFAQYLGKGDVELQAFSTFLVVAERGRDFPMQDLQDALSMSQSSVSRNVALLSVGTVSNPGPRLIEAYEDPEYRRRKHVRLTARGSKLMDEIRELLLVGCRKAGA